MEFLMMTIDEIYEKYEGVTFYFDHYYKYSFNYRNEERDVEIYVGGNGDEIYRFHAYPTATIITVGNIYAVYQDGEEIFYNR